MRLLLLFTLSLPQLFAATVTLAQAYSSIVPTAGQRPFTATVSGPADKTVIWSVNGITGGNNTVGTISSGLYTAPDIVPAANVVTIKAVSVADPSAAGTATLTIRNPTPWLTLVSPAAIPPGTVDLTVTGSRYMPGSKVLLGGAPLFTQFVSTTELRATAMVSPAQSGLTLPVTVMNPDPGASYSTPFSVQIVGTPAKFAPREPPQPLVSRGAAARFLEQATFGPNAAGIYRVQEVGFAAYLDEQFQVAPSPYPAAAAVGTGWSPVPERLIVNAVTGDDQVRERTAFALSQVFVTSIRQLFYGMKMIPYQEMLLAQSFGNFRDLLTEVTLHPSMGEYLTMVNNDKGNSSLGTSANENFARELLQLFTIGTERLQSDGTPVLDAQGRTVPGYDQKVVTAFARAFTGWTYPLAPGASPKPHNGAYYQGKMTPVDSLHDTDPKALLNGVTLPGGQTAAADLHAALDNVFQHPNLPPFFSKRLVQHLVTSNPSPAYVKRVAAAFQNNGKSVRGDMKAILKAILLDPEARQGDTPGALQPGFGRLKDPVVYFAGILRGLDTKLTDTNSVPWFAAQSGQDILNPASVFSYFSPAFALPGTAVPAPEFQTLTPYSALVRANFAHSMVLYSNPGFDLAPWASLAGDPNQLLDALAYTFLQDQMPSAMRQPILDAMAVASGNQLKAQTAIYLLVTSGFYQVQR